MAAQEQGASGGASDCLRDRSLGSRTPCQQSGSPHTSGLAAARRGRAAGSGGLVLGSVMGLRRSSWEHGAPINAEGPVPPADCLGFNWLSTFLHMTPVYLEWTRS